MDLPDTLIEALDAAAERDGDAPFLRCPGRATTAGTIQTTSRSIAAALRGWGVEPGDRAALMMPNGPEFLSVWFGVVRAGVIEVPVHTSHRGPLLQHILRESGAKVLFCDAELLARLEGLELPALERIVVMGDAGGPVAGTPTVSLHEALELPPSGADPDIRGSDVSCILYTSGTTGPSKGVVLTHSANLWLAKTNVDLMGYTSDDVLYTAFPLFHVNAKCTSVLSSMLVGADLVLDDAFSASRFWDRMREERVTSFNYMGGLLSILAKQPEREDDRDHQVTRAYGGACPPDLWEPFEARFGVRLHEHYGMTETGIIAWNTASERRIGSIGRPAPHFQVRLADEQDREVPVGEAGEIQVRPNEPGMILTEYWRRPDANRETFRNLWLHTGDRARSDEDGFLYYVDRIKDSIRRRGENISSFELESVIGAFAGVAECAAYGVPSDLGEDEVMVAIVTDPGAEIDVDELISYCRSRLARFAVPRYVRFMDALPKNASQRVQKFRLREAGATPDTVDCEPKRPPPGAR